MILVADDLRLLSWRGIREAKLSGPWDDGLLDEAALNEKALRCFHDTYKRQIADV